MNHFSLPFNGYQGQTGIIQDTLWEPIQNITELYRFDGEAFIREAYCNLYGREPDLHGMAYYLGRLAQGFDKTAIIAQMSKSGEAKGAECIAGLGALLAEERRAQSWFWGLLGAFGRRGQLRRQRTAQTDRFLAAQRETAVRSSHDIAVLHGAVQSIPWNLEAIYRNLEGMTQAVNALQHAVATKFGDQPSHAPQPQLSEEQVRKAFREILGRAPESDQVIEHHRHFPTYAELAGELMKSPEYQSKVSGHTLLIFKRLKAAYSAGLQGA